MHSIHADVNAHMIILFEGKKVSLESGRECLATLQWQIAHAPGFIVPGRNQWTLRNAGCLSDPEPLSNSILNKNAMPADVRDDDFSTSSCLIIL